MLHEHTPLTNVRDIKVNLKTINTVGKNQYQNRRQSFLELEKALFIARVPIEKTTLPVEVG